MPDSSGTRPATASELALWEELHRTKAELEALRESTSFRLGHALVLAPHRPSRSIREFAVVARRLARRIEAPRHRSESPTGSPLVTVIMTTFNSREFVAGSLTSLLKQTYPELEIVVVDDASEDGTFQYLNEEYGHDVRLRLIKGLKNRGTYWCRNLALTVARGEFITFQDSDDYSEPDRVAKQAELLVRNPDAVVATCKYVRKDDDGRLIENRGLYERMAIMCPMLRADALRQHIGFFDSVRIGADEELYRRLSAFFGPNAVEHVASPLYVAKHRPGSLTTASDAPVFLDATPRASDRLAHLSPVRRRYVLGFQPFHRAISDRRTSAYVDFPLRTRPFEAPAEILPGGPKPSPVIACMASIPRRADWMSRVVESLLPQVDRLCVYLNGYDDVPTCLDHAKVAVARSQEHGDLADNGKFFFLPDEASYVVTVDDDIAYPADYVRRLILKIEQYDRRAAVGVHGIVLAEPMQRFFADREVLLYHHRNDRDRFVELLGTGTVAFHTDSLELRTRDFRDRFMADLWFAIAARRQKLPLIAIARDAHWLKPLGAADDSLFAKFRDGGQRQTEIARRHGPWGRSSLLELAAPLAAELIERCSDRELYSRDVDVSFLNEAAGRDRRHPQETAVRAQ